MNSKNAEVLERLDYTRATSRRYDCASHALLLEVLQQPRCATRCLQLTLINKRLKDCRTLLEQPVDGFAGGQSSWIYAIGDQFGWGCTNAPCLPFFHANLLAEHFTKCKPVKGL